jgi:hypothetical protein
LDGNASRARPIEDPFGTWAVRGGTEENRAQCRFPPDLAKPAFVKVVTLTRTGTHAQSIWVISFWITI